MKTKRPGICRVVLFGILAVDYRKESGYVKALWFPVSRLPFPVVVPLVSRLPFHVSGVFSISSMPDSTRCRMSRSEATRCTVYGMVSSPAANLRM